ncbi:thioredoxin family protein [Methylotenera oryzisoli]|jgi:glutaredoxin|uniref:Thioredoxin family protein n=1 Tax=Methylotenera oryzisoli TaxID=2080758 RepID=A0A4Y9VSB0_9PROT|nr:glutaredoxin family protein [Methylotenera oryzisoli]TFW71203.1 thioredoxin family protein [Methylotenera oryzisoli]
MLALTLYTTSHCHLCEEAEAILSSIANDHDITWRTIEIADNNQLLETYGTTIPVIQITGTSSEIKWPFGAEEILALVKTDTMPK